MLAKAQTRKAELVTITTTRKLVRRLPMTHRKLALDDGLRQKIEMAAVAAGRSMHAEILDRLRRPFEDDRLARIEASIEKLLGVK